MLFRQTRRHPLDPPPGSVYTRLIRGLLAEYFVGCQGTVTSFREQLGCNDVLPALREIAAPHLASLPAPLGFRPLPVHSGKHKMERQHQTGPDPPIKKQ